jgi:hypothetical protein
MEFAIQAPEAQRVTVVGDWDNWQYSLPLARDPDTLDWVGSTHLRAGQYCYQYILDQRVAHNPQEEAGVYPGRGVVNMVRYEHEADTGPAVVTVTGTSIVGAHLGRIYGRNRSAEVCAEEGRTGQCGGGGCGT